MKINATKDNLRLVLPMLACLILMCVVFSGSLAEANDASGTDTVKIDTSGIEYIEPKPIDDPGMIAPIKSNGNDHSSLITIFGIIVVIGIIGAMISYALKKRRKWA